MIKKNVMQRITMTFLIVFFCVLRGTSQTRNSSDLLEFTNIDNLDTKKEILIRNGWEFVSKKNNFKESGFVSSSFIFKKLEKGSYKYLEIMDSKKGVFSYHKINLSFSDFLIFNEFITSFENYGFVFHKTGLVELTAQITLPNERKKIRIVAVSNNVNENILTLTIQYL